MTGADWSTSGPVGLASVGAHRGHAHVADLRRGGRHERGGQAGEEGQQRGRHIVRAGAPRDGPPLVQRLPYLPEGSRSVTGAGRTATQQAASNARKAEQLR